MTTPQLEERLSSVMETRIGDDGLEESAPAGTCRIGLVGTIVRQAVREAADTAPALRVVGEFQTVAELIEGLRPGVVDLLIIERDTIFPEEINEIQDAITQMRVRRAILVYRFAQEDVIQPLDIKRITALRAPVDAAEIQLACIADIQLALRSGKAEELPDPEEVSQRMQRPVLGDIPERAFSDEQLVRIAGMSSVVKCECPQHLASLLSSLAAFERYSERCEDRNEEDATLHAFLHKTTAQCRSQMEMALSEVLTQEGISI